MLSFMIALLVLVGLLIIGIVYLAQKHGKTKTKLFEDTWRTAGDQQKVVSALGPDTREGLQEASRGDKSRTENYQVKKEKLLRFSEWNS